MSKKKKKKNKNTLEKYNEYTSDLGKGKGVFKLRVFK